jgi:hypothetical protein
MIIVDFSDSQVAIPLLPLLVHLPPEEGAVYGRLSSLILMMHMVAIWGEPHIVVYVTKSSCTGVRKTVDEW